MANAHNYYPVPDSRPSIYLTHLGKNPCFRHEEATLNCQGCCKQFSTEAELQQHLRSYVISGRKLKVMVQCLTEEQVLSLAKPHPEGEDSQNHECHLCGEFLRSAKFLQDHVDLHSTSIPGKIKCALGKCNFIFASTWELKKHSELHYQALQVSCDFCGRIFNCKSGLRLHMKLHIGRRPLDCHVPGSSHTGKSHKHRKETPISILYTCLLCGENFKGHISFKRHVARHSTDTHSLQVSFVRQEYEKQRKSSA
jgi:KRAB domain-containing zinc finger protein